MTGLNAKHKRSVF